MKVQHWRGLWRLLAGEARGVGVLAGCALDLAPARHPGLHVFVQAFLAAFTPEAGFTIVPKAAGGVELVGAIDPHGTGFDLGGEVQRQVDVFAPDACRQPVAGVVGELHRFLWRAEGHGSQHGAEDFDCAIVEAGATLVNSVDRSSLLWGRICPHSSSAATSSRPLPRLSSPRLRSASVARAPRWHDIHGLCRGGSPTQFSMRARNFCTSSRLRLPARASEPAQHTCPG